MIRERREASELEKQRIRALARATLPLGSAHKRFARDLASALEASERRGEPALLTEPQAIHLARLAWRYRRQLPGLAPMMNPALEKKIFGP